MRHRRTQLFTDTGASKCRKIHQLNIMIVRNSTVRLAQAAVALFAAVWVPFSAAEAPVEVIDYDGLKDIVGTKDDYNTGERFQRDALVFFHNGAPCAPDYEKTGLGGYMAFPDMYAFVTVDTEHADKELLEKFAINTESMMTPETCKVLAVINRRSPVTVPDFNLAIRDQRGFYHAGVTKLQQVSVGITNEMDFPLAIHYIYMNDAMRPTHVKELPPGREQWILSYKTTYLVAVNAATSEEVGRHKVTGHGLFTIAPRDCGAETCGTSEGGDIPNDPESQNARKNMDNGRLANNKNQPAGLPRFTEVGFKKITVPDDVWDLVKAYYEENKESPKKEVWSKHNVFTNNVAAPSYMVNLPENGVLKKQIFEGLRPILEEWAGVKLVQTACYGIRVYTNTSWLANHVDTRSTHAVSVIMQVDQNVEEDWPLMIYDHAGNDYNITMKPRDLVLYESATCVHGRPSTFNGQYYANAFVHYKPVEHERWGKYVEYRS